MRIRLTSGAKWRRLNEARATWWVWAGPNSATSSLHALADDPHAGESCPGSASSVLRRELYERLVEAADQALIGAKDNGAA
jgi:hypothetical protein